MSFLIKGDLEKDIQPGDFVEVLNQQVPYDPNDGWEYIVIDINKESQQVLIQSPKDQSWLDAKIIDHVWREV